MRNAMSMSRLLPACALALALLGGCGLPVPGTPASAPAAPASATAVAKTSDAVTWADDFCGAVVTFQEASKKQPQIDPSSPKKALAGLRTYLNDFTAALDKAVADLEAAGPAPTPSGDAAVKALTDYLTSAKEAFAKAQASLDKASTSDPSSIMTAIQPLQSLTTPPDALKNLSSDPELDAAAAQAPNCKTLNAG
jgi:hypothetical protein